MFGKLRVSGDERLSVGHRLRIALSRCCFSACMAFIVFWIHSYKYYAFVSGSPTNTRCDAIVSWQGRVRMNSYAIGPNLRNDPPELDGGFVPHPHPKTRAHPSPSFLGFHLRIGRSWKSAAPHWFFTLLAGSIAFILKPKPRLRFSLKSLLFAMTLLAVMLGAVVVASSAFLNEAPKKWRPIYIGLSVEIPPATGALDGRTFKTHQVGPVGECPIRKKALWLAVKRCGEKGAFVRAVDESDRRSDS